MFRRVAFTAKVILPTLIRKICSLRNKPRVMHHYPYCTGWWRNQVEFADRNTYGDLYDRWMQVMCTPYEYDSYIQLLEGEYETGRRWCTMAKVECMVPSVSLNNNYNFNQLVEYMHNGMYIADDGKKAVICEPISTVYDDVNVKLVIDDGNQRYYAAKELGIDYMYSVIWEKK